MSAPNVKFTTSGNRISAVSGFDSITVTFSTDTVSRSFECRATKVGDNWGVGVGTLVASFSTTPANTARTFEIYDDYLTSGDGDYRISLFAQGEDGSWNDNGSFIPTSSGGLMTADSKLFFSMR